MSGDHMPEEVLGVLSDVENPEPLPAIDDSPEAALDDTHPEPTEEEIRLGNELGASIDVDDDDDVSGSLPEAGVLP